MPRVLIHTNLKDTDLPNDFEENVVQKISDVLKYPLEVNIEPKRIHEMILASIQLILY